MIFQMINTTDVPDQLSCDEFENDRVLSTNLAYIAYIGGIYCAIAWALASCHRDPSSKRTIIQFIVSIGSIVVIGYTETVMLLLLMAYAINWIYKGVRILTVSHGHIVAIDSLYLRDLWQSSRPIRSGRHVLIWAKPRSVTWTLPSHDGATWTYPVCMSFRDSSRVAILIEVPLHSSIILPPCRFWVHVQEAGGPIAVRRVTVYAVMSLTIVDPDRAMRYPDLTRRIIFFALACIFQAMELGLRWPIANYTNLETIIHEHMDVMLLGHGTTVVVRIEDMKLES